MKNHANPSKYGKYMLLLFEYVMIHTVLSSTDSNYNYKNILKKVQLYILTDFNQSAVAIRRF